MDPQEPIATEAHLPATAEVAGVFPTNREAFESGLVILAMNVPYWHVHEDHEHRLYVEGEVLTLVKEELAMFQDENATWQAQLHSAAEIELKPASFYIPYFLFLVLSGAFLYQHTHSPWVVQRAGMDSVAFVAHQEWWRAFTALFLHADLVHLLSNLFFGLWYGAFVNQSYGSAAGWSLILLSGIAGNTGVAFYYYPAGHLAIGASTAVFGSLGLLVAAGLADRIHERTHSLGRLLIPLTAGGIMLSLTGGFDDPVVDGLAHLLGFLCGLLFGMAWFFLLRLRLRRPFQRDGC